MAHRNIPFISGGLTAAVGYLAETSKAQALAPYIGSPKLLLFAIVAMFIAGACGGGVASWCTECNTYEELWKGKHGPFGSRLLTGQQWALLEHVFFWVSAISAAIAVLWSKPVIEWVSK